MKAEEMWNLYKMKSNIKGNTYEAWAFGGDANLLANLVLEGKKTATASAYPLYKLENEPLPLVGGYNIILNAQNEAVCITRTVKVYVVPL